MRCSEVALQLNMLLLVNYVSARVCSVKPKTIYFPVCIPFVFVAIVPPKSPT